MRKCPAEKASVTRFRSMAAPKHPKVYHIIHVDNLPAIIAEGGPVSDATMIDRDGPSSPIGMSEVKARRLTLPVDCHTGDYVGDCVPFYFCPRSIMLFLIHKANHPGLLYRGGQEPIIHIEADLGAVVGWANQNDHRWAFSLSNAGSYYAQFRKDVADLGEIDWSTVASTNFTAAQVKEGKQAEFLLHGSFPWKLVSRIGVCSITTARKAHNALSKADHRPPIKVIHDWYF